MLGETGSLPAGSRPCSVRAVLVGRSQAGAISPPVVVPGVYPANPRLSALLASLSVDLCLFKYKIVAVFEYRPPTHSVVLGSGGTAQRRVCRVRSAPLTLRDETAVRGPCGDRAVRADSAGLQQGRGGSRRSRQSLQQGQAGRGRADGGAALAHLGRSSAALLQP